MLQKNDLMFLDSKFLSEQSIVLLDDQQVVFSTDWIKNCIEDNFSQRKINNSQCWYSQSSDRPTLLSSLQ